MRKNVCGFTVLILALASYSRAAMITDVRISPPQPSVFDVITIESQGIFPGGTNWYDTSVLTINQLSLQLDLYFTGGSGPQIPQPWFHDEEIGALLQGSYALLVQSYWRSSASADYLFIDDYSTTFAVVPEPLTLAFLALGAALVRRQ